MQLFTTKDGVTINYRTSGEGNAILLIHTVFDNLTVFNELEARYNQDHQVISVDLRGHGYSDKPTRINFEDYANDLKGLLDELYIEQCAVIGHEMGASVAAGLAAQYPEMVSSLTLVNPTILEDMLPVDRLYKHYAPKIRNWEEDKQQKFLDEHLYYSKRKAKKFLKQVEDTNTLHTKTEIAAVKRSFRNNHIREYLGRISMPTMVIVGQHGERTTIVEAKEVADYISGVQFEVFEESGLYPFAEQLDVFVKVTSDFLTAHESKLLM